MKKISYISLFMFVLTMCGVFVSCSKNEDENAGDNGSSGGNNGSGITDVTVKLTSLDYTSDGYFDGVLYYQITSNSPCTMEITKMAESVVNVVVPQYVIVNDARYTVTKIKDNAFYQHKNLSSIILSNSIENIGDAAFSGCYNLASIIFGRNIKSIGRAAFSGCNSLTRAEYVSIESLCGIQYAEASSHPFYSGYRRDLDNKIPFEPAQFVHRFLYINGKEINNLSIPNNITSINDYLFCGCSGLLSVTIPNSVISIGKYVFYGCTELTSLAIGNSVTNIGDCAFSGCTGLTSVVIPNSVTNIGNYAFQQCTGLTSVVIPNSVTAIGDFAFSYCI